MGAPESIGAGNDAKHVKHKDVVVGEGVDEPALEAKLSKCCGCPSPCPSGVWCAECDMKLMKRDCGLCVDGEARRPLKFLASYNGA